MNKWIILNQNNCKTNRLLPETGKKTTKMKKAKQKHFDHRILKANIQLSTRWLMTIKILMEKVSKNIEILVVLKNFAANPICDFVSYIYIVTNIFI